MQDIDFDEIDRAVSSVGNKDTQAVTANVAASEDTSMSSLENILSQPAQPEVQPEATPVASVSPAARRSSGRFMDVVHPSSDMRPQAPAAATFHREEVTPPVAPVEQVAVPPRSEPAATASSAFHWPDPIDMAEETTVAEPSVEESIDTPELAQEEPEATPLESPFLSGAKVEKRPLGAFSNAESELPLLEDFPAPVSAPVESIETPVVEESVTPDVVAAVENQSIPETETVAIAPPVVSAAVETPVGPTSITQQYTEQPSTASQPSGSIYDTEAYHKPLANPTSKKSGPLMLVVWIVALVLIGGGIGAALYFLVLPMIG